MPYADLVSFVFALVAIVLPRIMQQLSPRMNSIIIISILFICSLVGGLVYKWMTGDSGTPAFSRIFFIAGLSHLIILAVYNEIYRRIEVRQIQIDHAQKEQKES